MVLEKIVVGLQVGMMAFERHKSFWTALRYI
jgi:hypothetical protein